MPFESDKIMSEVYKEATYSVFWTTPSPGPAGRDHPLPQGGEGMGCGCNSSSTRSSSPPGGEGTGCGCNSSSTRSSSPPGGEGTGAIQCAGTETLDEFLALLEAHVRKEERRLFPEFEKRMPSDEAFKVGQEIESRLLKVCPPHPGLIH